MSTMRILSEHEAANPAKLVRFCPAFVGGERERRPISMAPQIHAWLHSTAKTDRIRNVKAAARTHFAEFVKGNPIDDRHYMKLVEDKRVGAATRFSHGVWSFRTRFEPQHRFFGVFACPDWFLVFRKQLRKNLQNDTHWHSELDRTLTAWRAFFPGINVYTGTRLHHYVKSNASHRDERWYPI